MIRKEYFFSFSPNIVICGITNLINKKFMNRDFALDNIK